MRPDTLLRYALALALAIGVGGWLAPATAQSLTAEGAPGGPTVKNIITDLSARGGGDLLYDQVNTAATSGIVSQSNTVNTDWDAIAADNFVVSEGETWTVTQVYVRGFYGGTTAPEACENAEVGFWSSTGTEPDAPLFVYDVAPTTDVNGALTLDIPATELAEGEYWLSTVCSGPNLEFDVPNNNVTRWNWYYGPTAAIGAPAVLRNDGGGFGIPPGWNPFPSIGIAQQNLSFALFGTGGGGGGGDCPDGLDFCEDFEAGIPGDWTIFANEFSTGNTPWIAFTQGALGNVARSSWSSAVPEGEVSEDYLATPLLSLGAGAYVQFDAAEAFSGEFGSEYEVLVSTTSADDPAAYATVASYTESDFPLPSDGAATFTVDLSAYAGQSVYIAFLHRQNDGDVFYLDNVGVSLGNGGGGGISLPITFEEEIDYELTDFGGNASELVADPEDPSNTVVRSIRTAGAECFAGTTVAETSGFTEPIPFEPGATTMSVRVWSPEAGTRVRFKVEKVGDPTVSVEADVFTTQAMAWETLVFDFVADQVPDTAPIDFDAEYTKASIFFNFQCGVGDETLPELTYYWDDVAFGGEVTPPDGALTFSPSPLVEELESGETGTETVTITNTTDQPVAYDFSQYSGGDRGLSPAHGQRFPRLDLAKGDDDPRRGSGQAFGAGGPDEFGYRWIDSNEPGGPTFNWVDISGTGTAVSLGDDQGVAVDLPFTFSFYGDDKTSVTIGSNGYLTFDGNGGDFSNDPIPTAATPNDFIAPFWDDLDPGDGNGAIYYQDMGDGRFVVQYDGVPDFPGPGVGTENTFQVILNQSGSILFQYQEMLGDILGATVGIENATGTDGLQIAFNEAYLEDGLAVLINAAPTFVTDVDPATGVIPAGGSVDVAVTFDATGLVGGTYDGTLVVETDLDGPDSTFELPVVLVVEGDPACALALDPASFGDVIVGNAATATATVSNTGTDACELTAASASGPFAVEGFAPTSVAPGGSYSFEVVYTPTEPGPDAGTLTVSSPSGDLTAALSGSALGQPTPEVDPDALTVTVMQGSTETTSFTVTNAGGTDAADLEYEVTVVAARPAGDAVAGNADAARAGSAGSAAHARRRHARCHGWPPRRGPRPRRRHGGPGALRRARPRPRDAVPLRRRDHHALREPGDRPAHGRRLRLGRVHGRELVLPGLRPRGVRARRGPRRHERRRRRRDGDGGAGHGGPPLPARRPALDGEPHPRRGGDVHPPEHRARPRQRPRRGVVRRGGDARRRVVHPEPPVGRRRGVPRLELGRPDGPDVHRERDVRDHGADGLRRHRVPRGALGDERERDERALARLGLPVVGHPRPGRERRGHRHRRRDGGGAGHVRVRAHRLDERPGHAVAHGGPHGDRRRRLVGGRGGADGVLALAELPEPVRVADGDRVRAAGAVAGPRRRLRRRGPPRRHPRRRRAGGGVPRGAVGRVGRGRGRVPLPDPGRGAHADAEDGRRPVGGPP
jgi:hypothetical protein